MWPAASSLCAASAGGCSEAQPNEPVVYCQSCQGALLCTGPACSCLTLSLPLSLSLSLWLLYNKSGGQEKVLHQLRICYHHLRIRACCMIALPRSASPEVAGVCQRRAGDVVCVCVCVCHESARECQGAGWWTLAANPCCTYLYPAAAAAPPVAPLPPVLRPICCSAECSSPCLPVCVHVGLVCVPWGV